MNRTAISRKRIFRISASIIGMTIILCTSQLVMASDPTGIYALVDKVVLEPNENAPERIQIWGTFIVSTAETGSAYGQPAHGYLYFSLPSGKEQVAKTEWSDLKKMAGTGHAVAFGNRYMQIRSHVRVRKSDEKAESPEPYPTGMGLTKLEDSNYQVKSLKAASASR